MQMPGRNASTGDYRYGFQGQETDNEITGSESHIAFKYRIHDARLGRFLSLDPLAPDYPHNSPYAFSENLVISHIELEGAESQRTGTATTTTGYQAAIDNTASMVYKEQRYKAHYFFLQPELIAAATLKASQSGRRNAAVDNTQLTKDVLAQAENTMLPNVVGVIAGQNHTGEVDRLDAAKGLAVDLVFEVVPFGAFAGFIAKPIKRAGKTFIRSIGKVRTSTVRGFRSTEPFAQSDDAISAISERLEAGDQSVFDEDIFTTTIDGETYVLDGHNRLESAVAVDFQGEIPITELSNEEAWDLFKSKMEDIENYGFDSYIGDQ